MLQGACPPASGLLSPSRCKSSLRRGLLCLLTLQGCPLTAQERGARPGLLRASLDRTAELMAPGRLRGDSHSRHCERWQPAGPLQQKDRENKKP